MDSEAKAFSKTALLVAGVIAGVLAMLASVLGFALLVPFAVYGCIYQLQKFFERRSMLKEAATADLDAELRKLQGD